MKPFHFKQFSILQSEKVFRVGTDGVLLGALATVESSQRVLEVGTGTGLISLMLAQRNAAAEILAVDIDENAANLARENFKNSIFSERLNVLNIDFKTFETSDQFDLIVCNPPYFEENSSSKEILARQKIKLDFLDLIQKSKTLLNEDGILSVIIPSDSAQQFIELCEAQNLYLNRKINIFGIKGNSLPKRNILEFSLNSLKLKNLIEENFTIEKSPRKYSDQYLELTKEFHVFKK